MQGRNRDKSDKDMIRDGVDLVGGLLWICTDLGDLGRDKDGRGFRASLRDDRLRGQGWGGGRSSAGRLLGGWRVEPGRAATVGSGRKPQRERRREVSSKLRRAPSWR